MGIVGVEIPLKDGEDWDDPLTLTMTRMEWNVTLALMVEKGKDMHEVIDAAMKAAQEGDPAAAIAALLLNDSSEKVGDVVRKITEIAHPEVAREARAEVANAHWRDKMSEASNMFRDLTDDEEADFRAWAREHYTPGDRINPVWHPVVRDECDRINLDA